MRMVDMLAISAALASPDSQQSLLLSKSKGAEKSPSWPSMPGDLWSIGLHDHDIKEVVPN